MSYAGVVEALSRDIDERCGEPLNIVVLDGIPATGKSELARTLATALEDRGRSVATIENDWFIAQSIRNPTAIAWGLAVALSPLSRGSVEQRLLREFLDSSRLRAFQDELTAAREELRTRESAELCPQGAFWNLHTPRPWESETAAGGLTLGRGAVVLIEGTLTTATYRPRFPDLVSVRVRVPPTVARERFRARNEDPARRRNFAFSSLALTTVPLRLADQLIDRHAADFELDLTSFERPVIVPAPAWVKA